MKFSELNFSVELYDGTKIFNTNEPSNCFLEGILLFSFDDSNYLGKEKD